MYIFVLKFGKMNIPLERGRKFVEKSLSCFFSQANSKWFILFILNGKVKKSIFSNIVYKCQVIVIFHLILWYKCAVGK